MKRTVRWTISALDDLDRSIAYIAERDEAAARRVRRKVTAAIELLSRHAVGRPSRIAGRFEKLVIGTRYTVLYGLDGNMLLVLRIVHQSRNWPEEDWPSEG